MRRTVWTLAAALAVLCVAGLGAAAAGAADYCPMLDETYCLVTDDTTQNTCCVDMGNGTRRLATCTRQLYYCTVPSYQEKWGPAYNCTSFGEVCQ